jgi:hypothetical protein
MGVCGRYPSFQIAASAKQLYPKNWQISKVHTDPLFFYGFQNFAVQYSFGRNTRKAQLTLGGFILY